MSQANVELARRLYPTEVDLVTAIADPTGVEALRPFIHPDFEMVQPAGEIPVGTNRVQS